MKPRAALHQSAPSAITRAMSKPEVILPDAPSLMRSRRRAPTNAECTKVNPSPERHAEMVHEFEQGGPGAAFRCRRPR